MLLASDVENFSTGCFSEKNLPSSISGGNPPTKTFREKRSPLSDPCEWGDERAGDPIVCKLLPSRKFPPPLSSASSH